MESERLIKALGRFSQVRERLEEKRKHEQRFLLRCGALLEGLMQAANSDDMVLAVETLGDLTAFRHTDGDGNDVRLVFSSQRDRAIINRRYLSDEPSDAQRDGSDLLLAINKINSEVNPNRCLVYRLLKPVEILAIYYPPDSEEPATYIDSNFGLLASRHHMLDFIDKLAESAANSNDPLPSRDAIPELIERCLEDQLAESIESQTEKLELSL
jgi:hypothetical protein